MQQLTSLDAQFLAIETPRTYGHVGGLAVYDPSTAPAKDITHEDIWLMKRTGEPVVSPDGRSVIVSVIEPDYDAAKQSSDLWLIAADGHEAPKQLTFTKAVESGQVWSPDGTRLAFVTRREGDDAPQVYALTTGGGEAQRITHVSGGASNPQWRRDGRELFYLDTNGSLMVVDVDPSRQKVSSPRALFQVRLPGTLIDVGNYYTPAGDGQRFLVNSLDEGGDAEPIRVLTNWTAGLHQ